MNVNSSFKKNKVTGLGLSSGGLDSILSALVLKKQGIDVIWISFKTPFFSSNQAIKASKDTKIPIIINDITDIYLKMLENPKAGYGKNMNPCMDCHALMFSEAGKIMKKYNYDFLFSGEVIGQRPKSQNKNSLRYVEKKSGFAGFILRPLSAKILPKTVVEKQGIVNREKLFSISGRSRKIQIKMADDFGIKDYPAPAGGCLLTDKNFSARLHDLMFVQKKYKKKDLYLLRYGRHIRLNKKIKIVVGRSKDDNDKILENYEEEKDILIKHAFLPSPVLLISSKATPDIIKQAASICASYTKTKIGDITDIKIESQLGEEIIKAAPIAKSSINQFI
ncbi:MAG: tRNA 4-thiouridine(8) synthase ThiI [Desulfobacteraceae bacterium 4572_130]|nr:MAG: tRNA 4-thiouridine(8) synthase ThiI [Desulfobacteraceae bacterium 4572_130]